MVKRRLQAHLEGETQAGALLGGARIRLLEAAEKFGSISKAAQRIPMSYKAARDALDDLNNLADFPVIERNIGGAGGGGTKSPTTAASSWRCFAPSKTSIRPQWITFKAKSADRTSKTKPRFS